MVLPDFFTFLPLALSVFSFSFSVVCVIFFYHMFAKLLDSKYLVRLFLMSSITLYFAFDVLYYLNASLVISSNMQMKFYSLRELSLFLLALILLVCMKEVFYKSFFHARMLNLVTNIFFAVFVVVIIFSFMEPNLFVKQVTIYLNDYQNRVNIYGIGIAYIVRDISIAFILVFNTICMLDIVIFQKIRVKYNVIILFSMFVLLIAFVDDSYALYFLQHKTKLFPFLSRISVGLFLFLAGLLFSSILRLLDTLKMIEKNKPLFESKIKSENSFIESSSMLLDNTLVIEESLCNISMKLINTSRSSIDYINTLKSKLENIYEKNNDFLKLEYSKQSKSSYNKYTLSKLSKSFIAFDETILKVKDAISSMTKTIDELLGKSDTISDNSKSVLKSIKDYSNISKEKVEIISSYFRKNKSSDMLPSHIKRILMSVKNMSERISTISVNSSIQSSKSGEYAESFSFISKEINSLVDDTIHATTKLEYIMTSASKMFGDFSNARLVILDNIYLLNNYISSLNLSVSSVSDIFSLEDDNNKNIIDNNKALDTFAENILFLLNDAKENSSLIKKEIDSIIEGFSKIDLEFNNSRKKIYFSRYDINKLSSLLNELYSSSIEFDKTAREISTFFDRIF